MKKKSPPYHFIGAAVLFVVMVLLLVRYAQNKEKEKEDAVAAANAAAAQQLTDAKAHQVTVQETPTNLRPVLYATQPIEAGVRLSSAFFEKKQTPQDILPDAYGDPDAVIGMYVVRRIEKGDPLTPRNIGKTLPYLSQRISPGMREISLPIFNSDVNDAGGYIVDGDRVDLLYTTKSQDNAFILKVETVLQNLSILSVPGSPVKTEKTDGINQIASAGVPISVTFEVTPEQAEALVFLSQVKNGEFSMILRGRKDQEEVKIKPFVATDYSDGLKKVQRMTDKSMQRVQELAIKIQEEEKKQGQDTTNETTTPIPPSL